LEVLELAVRNHFLGPRKPLIPGLPNRPGTPIPGPGIRAVWGTLETGQNGQNLKSRFGPKGQTRKKQQDFPYTSAVPFGRTLKTRVFGKKPFWAVLGGFGGSLKTALRKPFLGSQTSPKKRFPGPPKSGFQGAIRDLTFGDFRHPNRTFKMLLFEN